MNEYINKAIPKGSSLYYSLRFIDEQQRLAISNLYTFSYEIETIVSQHQEKEIAKRKLDWWEQELNNLKTGNPTHPITKSLQPILHQYAISTTVLQEIFLGISKRLSNPNYSDYKTFSEQHYRAVSSFPLFVALITIPSEETRPLSFVHDLGIALQTIEVIHNLRLDLKQGYVYLPEQDLVAYNVDVQQLLHLTPSPNLMALLTKYANQARDCYQKAIAKLDKQQKKSQLPSLILAKLYLKLLDEITDDNFAVLEHQVLLPPLRKLWLAWRYSIMLN